jgi:hypothetical protein
VIGLVARGTADDMEQAVAAARAAFEGVWWQTKPKERARLLFDLARAIEAEADALAELETLDSGKPLPLSKKEVLSTARYFEFYAGAADKFYGDSIPLGPDYVDFTLREPMGVTAHIVPWNMPLNMVGRSVAPALAMGNTAVVKPAEQTPLTALKLAELMEQVGIPAGVYNVVTGFGEEAGAPLTEHPDIDSITFTGSVPTGRRIMAGGGQTYQAGGVGIGRQVAPYYLCRCRSGNGRCRSQQGDFCQLWPDLLGGIAVGDRRPYQRRLPRQSWSNVPGRYGSVPAWSRPTWGRSSPRSSTSAFSTTSRLGSRKGPTAHRRRPARRAGAGLLCGPHPV